MIDAHDHAQSGGLSGAVRSDKSVDGSPRHCEREAIHRNVLSEGFGYVFDLNDVHRLFEQRNHSRIPALTIQPFGETTQSTGKWRCTIESCCSVALRRRSTAPINAQAGRGASAPCKPWAVTTCLPRCGRRCACLSWSRVLVLS